MNDDARPPDNAIDEWQQRVSHRRSRLHWKPRGPGPSRSGRAGRRDRRSIHGPAGRRPGRRALRYFNVAGADPAGRSGQSTREAFHLIHVAVQAALGRRQGMDVFGSDYPTADGSCIRDYVHVTDLARAHVDALTYLQSGGESLTCNVGYGRGYSVLDVIDVVKHVCRVDFDVRMRERRPGDPAILVASNAKAKSILRWRSCHEHLEQIVQHALSWERQLKLGVPA